MSHEPMATNPRIEIECPTCGHLPHLPKNITLCVSNRHTTLISCCPGCRNWLDARCAPEAADILAMYGARIYNFGPLTEHQVQEAEQHMDELIGALLA